MPPFKCTVEVFPKEGIASPEAATVAKYLPIIAPDLRDRVTKFKSGKIFTFVIESPTPEEASQSVEPFANFLANAVIEQFSVEVEPVVDLSNQ